MVHDSDCEFVPEGRLPGCLCATRAWERDPLPGAARHQVESPPMVAPRLSPMSAVGSWANTQYEPGETP